MLDIGKIYGASAGLPFVCLKSGAFRCINKAYAKTRDEKKVYSAIRRRKRETERRNYSSDLKKVRRAKMALSTVRLEQFSPKYCHVRNSSN